MVESFRGRPYAENHFRSIVDTARKTNAFYRRWITDPDAVPVIDRMTYLEHNDEILAGHPVTGRTSGSTGVPVRFSQSTEWKQRANKDMLAFVNALGGRRRAVGILYLEKPGHDDELSVSAPVDDQIEFILRRRRTVGTEAVTTYPTNAEILARRIIDRGIDMSFVTRFGMYGESVEPHHKSLVREAFPNAQIWTTYSALEFGLIAGMCPHEPEFHHLSAHRLGVEILREDGTPAGDGEVGRVVITDYFNQRTPFIRYDLGDYAERGQCPCGRIRLPALRQIHGKVRGALVHRNGNRVLFADLSVALRDNDGMRQYQVIQDGLEEFTVKMVSDRNLDTEVREAFVGHFGYLPSGLRTEYVESIPRGRNGKFHAAICNI